MTKINQFIKFEPILKQKIWGGEKLSKILNKKSSKKNIGESWEVSGVKDSESVVTKGDLKGRTLIELIESYTFNFLGEKVFNEFGNDFPLLIKFIDADKALSIQVHPDNAIAMKKHNSFGKTEMWYVMDSDEQAELIVGFKKEVNEEKYLHHLKTNTLLEILNVDKIKKGDTYFIPSGRVHAIGAGVLLAEIQQTSDLTYRIYDWERKDIDGNYRDLHTDDAIKVIDYSTKSNYKTTYTVLENTASQLVSCPFFTTNLLKITKTVSINHQDKDSFVIYMCVSGEVLFNSFATGEEKLSKGETLVVPACVKEFTISSIKESDLLEVFI